MRKFKKTSVCLIAIMIIISLMPMSVFASSEEVKMTAYDQVLKKGNTVFCAGAGGLYKVILKNGRVKSKKYLERTEFTFAPKGYNSAMYKKGSYLYFLSSSEGTGGSISRVKTSGGKIHQLATVPLWDFVYAIKDNEIYYYEYPEDLDSSYSDEKSVMSLNGKNKSATSKTAVLKTKNSNAKNYKLITKKSGKYYKDYLKTPKGKFYLGKAECSDW